MNELKTVAQIEEYINDILLKIKRVKRSELVVFKTFYDHLPNVAFTHITILENQVLKATNDAALNVLYNELETYQNRLKQLQE